MRVFLSDPLHGMAGTAVEFVGFGRGHDNLRPDDAAGAYQKPGDDEREEGHHALGVERRFHNPEKKPP